MSEYSPIAHVVVLYTERRLHDDADEIVVGFVALYFTEGEHKREVTADHLPFGEIDDVLENLLAHGIGYTWEVRAEDGTRLRQGVAIPNDTSYVAPDDEVFVLQHRTFDTWTPFLSEERANVALERERDDATEAGCSADVIDGYYVASIGTVAEHAPDIVRLQGHDAVIEFLSD